jgi:hypothetical protein
MNRPTSVAALLAVALCVAGPARAQTGAPPAPRTPPRLAVATNPLAIPFGVFTLDVETATRTPGLTFGAGGTWMTEDEDTAWADARLMYFPGEVVLRGFAIGVTGGVVHEQGNPNSTRCDDRGVCRPERSSETAPTLGVRIDYDWLVGARKRMLVGLGLGAKRTLRDVGAGSTLDQVYGDGRFIIGLTF